MLGILYYKKQVNLNNLRIDIFFKRHPDENRVSSKNYLSTRLNVVIFSDWPSQIQSTGGLIQTGSHRRGM